jgi:hypothetical protein
MKRFFPAVKSYLTITEERAPKVQMSKLGAKPYETPIQGLEESVFFRFVSSRLELFTPTGTRKDFASVIPVRKSML